MVVRFIGQMDVFLEIALNTEDFINKRFTRSRPLTDTDKEIRKSKVACALFAFPQVKARRGLNKSEGTVVPILVLL